MASRSHHGGGGYGEPIGAMLARLRLARGFSQLQLAHVLCAVAATPTLTRHEVSRWEREERIPGEFWRSWLAVVLNTPLDELEAAAAAARRPPADRPTRRVDPRLLWHPPTASELVAALDRANPDDLRDLAHAWLIGPTDQPGPDPEPDPPPPAGAGAGWPGSGPAAGGPGEPPDHINALDTLDARLSALRRQDDQVGGLDHARHVDRELRAAIEALRTVNGAARQRRALRVVAGFAQLAGWTHADAGDDPAARRAYRAALRAAAAAGDRALTAHVLGALSHHAFTTGDPGEALLLAQTGYAGAHAGGTALTRTLLLHRIALAAAGLGERRAAGIALADAERAFDRVDRDQEPDWLYWLDAAELTAMTGRCLAVLGRPARAVRRLNQRRWESVPSPWPGIGKRTRVLYATWLARSFIACGEVEQACREATRVLPEAIRSGSVRAAVAIRHLHPMLLRHRDVPVVRRYERMAAEAFDYLPDRRPGRDRRRGARGRRASVAV